MTLCGHCNKPLKDFEEVHSVRGTLYCSRECAIDDLTNDTIMSAKEVAIEDYASFAEVVATKDILADEMRELVEEDNSTRGVKQDIYTSYISDMDRTIIWQDLIVNGEVIQSMIAGWYHGEPDEQSTKSFMHNANVAHYLW